MTATKTKAKSKANDKSKAKATANKKAAAKLCYKVANSPIHGKGLFAATGIAEGQVLGVCKHRPAKESGLHTLTFDDGSLHDVTCSLKYINHGRPANVIYYDDFSVVALRDIDKGEELFHDYGDEWD